MSEDDKKHGREIEDRIRDLAYSMWESAGRLPGLAQEYWIAAEKEVLATWQRVTEQVLPGEKPEKAEESEAEASKPSPSETPKVSKAAAEVAEKAPKPKAETEEPEKPRTVTKKPASPETARAKSAAAKPKAKTTRAKPQKRSPEKPAVSDRPQPAEVTKPYGETAQKIETASAATAEAPTTAKSKPAFEPEAKKEGRITRKRTTRRTRQNTTGGGRTRRLDKK